MKRFKKFLTEAEAAPMVEPQQMAPANDFAYNLPPGVPGTRQHGPPSPSPEREYPRVVPDAPQPRNFENFNDFWEAYQRWLYERALGTGFDDLDWDRYYKFVRDEWKRYMRERPSYIRNPPRVYGDDEVDLTPVIPEA